MLLALVTAQQTQTLSKLDTSCMQETTTGITFTIRDTLKTTRPGKHLAPIEIRPFAPDSRLCPVTYIKHYITKTNSLRSNPRLLISYTKPHKPVTNSTVARWIRSTLQDAGIDVSSLYIVDIVVAQPPPLTAPTHSFLLRISSRLGAGRTLEHSLNTITSLLVATLVKLF